MNQYSKLHVDPLAQQNKENVLYFLLQLMILREDLGETHAWWFWRQVSILRSQKSASLYWVRMWISTRKCLKSGASRLYVFKISLISKIYWMSKTIFSLISFQCMFSTLPTMLSLFYWKLLRMWVFRNEVFEDYLIYVSRNFHWLKIRRFP